MINTSNLSSEELTIYNKLLSKLPETITESDYAIFVALLSILMEGVNYNISELYRQLNVETADEPYLRQLALLVGYTWLDTLSVEANRARLMYYEYSRKYRGTLDAIKNLARASIDEESFYSNAENSKIKVYEGSKNPYEPNTPGYVITLELPDSFTIMRSDIEEVRPAGTLLRFVYKLILLLTENNLGIIGSFGLKKIRMYMAKIVSETIAGDDPALVDKVLQTWGYYNTLNDRWNTPLVLSSTSPGVTQTLAGTYEIVPLKDRVTISGFIYLAINTDWISEYLTLNSYSEGTYTINIENDKIEKVTLEGS